MHDILSHIPPIVAKCYRPEATILSMELLPPDLHIGCIEDYHENFIYYYDENLKRTFPLELITPIGIGVFSFDFMVKPDSLLLNIYSSYQVDISSLGPTDIFYIVRETGLITKEAMNYRNSVKVIL